MKVEPLETIGYCITLYMNDTHLPKFLCAELNDKDFLKYIRKEIKEMRLDRVQYGTLNLIEKYFESPCQNRT